MQRIQEVHALDAQPAQNADDELAEDRELGQVEAEGHRERRGGD